MPSYRERLECVFLELIATGCSGKSGKKSVTEGVARKQVFARLEGVACNLKWLVQVIQSLKVFVPLNDNQT